MKNTKHNGKEVSIRNKDNFEYDGVHITKIEDLNSEKANELRMFVAHYLENEEAIKIEERRVAIEARRVENQKLQDAFKTKLMAINSFEGYELQFNTINGEYGDRARFVRIRKNNDSVELYFSATVHKQDGWRSSKTERVWATEVDYKTIRYTKLETAVKKVLERLDELVENRLEKQRAEDKEMFEENELRKFAKGNGFEFEKVWNSSRWKANGGYYTFVMKKGKVVANIVYHNDKVKITSYTCGGEGITVEYLQEVA